jgi:hypothetical protein
VILRGIVSQEKMHAMRVCVNSPSDVTRSLPPECVEKGLNGAGECVVSEIDLVMTLKGESKTERKAASKIRACLGGRGATPFTEK